MKKKSEEEESEEETFQLSFFNFYAFGRLLNLSWLAKIDIDIYAHYLCREIIEAVDRLDCTLIKYLSSSDDFWGIEWKLRRWK